MNCPGGNRGFDDHYWRHYALVAVLALPAPGWLPGPHRSQMVDLLDQLSAARGMPADEPPQVDQACGDGLGVAEGMALRRSGCPSGPTIAQRFMNRRKAFVTLFARTGRPRQGG